MINPLLRLTAILPPIIITLLAYLRIDFSNPYILLGMFSLIAISLSEKVKFVGVTLVYVPVIYTVYLLLAGVIDPFLGLAAGYILSGPLVFALNTFNSRSSSGILSGYFTSYIASLLIYGAASSDGMRPERIFINIVQNVMGIFSREQLNIIPPSTPPTTLLATITAISTIALIFLIASPRQTQKPLISSMFIKAFVIMAVLLAASTISVQLFSNITSVLILCSLIALGGWLSITVRRSDD